MSPLAIIILIAMILIGIMLLKFAVKVFFVFLPMLLLCFVVNWFFPGTYAYLTNTAQNVAQQSAPAVGAGIEKAKKISKDAANVATGALQR
jgi:energy-coupling factor transporter transmembrane protein EcfT